jgi:hypothetical protein
MTGPVQVGGAEISKRLVTKLLNDVGDDPDQLPVLQHALMRTWDGWARDHAGGEPVDIRHYEATGGMQEALSRHADEVFDALHDDSARRIAARLFKSLTERVDETRGIRRPLLLGRLAEVAGAPVEAVSRVIDAFRTRGSTFLMPPESVELTPRTVIDISHESLMRVWQRLRRWVDEEAQSAGIYRRLVETAELHARGRAGLYHDPDLGIALSWREEDRPNPAWAGLYGGDFHAAMGFLDQSQAESEREERERESARQRELEQARALAESQARAAALMKRLAATVCVALVLAVGLAAWALRESRIAAEATKEAYVEQGRTWLANARALVEAKDRFGAKLKAARAIGFAGLGRELRGEAFEKKYRVFLAPGSDAWGEAERLVSAHPGFVPLWQSGSMPQHEGMVNDVCLSPTDSLAVTAPEVEGGLRVWDVETGAELFTLSGHQDDVEAVAFSPDGRRFASAENRTVVLWDIRGRSFTESRRLDLDVNALRALDFSPGGGRLAIADSEGTLLVWDLASDKTTTLQGLHEGARIDDLEWSPDGSLLASAARDGAVELRDGAALELVAPLTPPVVHSAGGRAVQALSLGFSRDGRRLVVGGMRMPAVVWDVAARRPATGRSARGRSRRGMRSSRTSTTSRSRRST